MTERPGASPARGEPTPEGRPNADLRAGPVDSMERRETSRAGVRASFLTAMPMWATCALLTIGGYQLLLAQGRSPFNVVFIVVLLGILAWTSLLKPPARAIALLTLGLVLAWQLPIYWLLTLLPPDLARAGKDFAWIGGLTVLIVTLVTAIWRRPPTRRPDGSVVLESRLINWIALMCAVGGPIIGWAVYSEFARGDIYMRPLFIGLAVGLYGLLLMSAYAVLTIIARPRAAAILALLYPVLLVAAAHAPRWAVAIRSEPVAIVEDVSMDGRSLRASGRSLDHAPAYAFDGRTDTAWNAGRSAPAWIEVDLGKPTAIAEIRLLVAQFPEGETIHQVTAIDSTGREAPLGELRGSTREGQWLSLSTPQTVGVRSVRVTTLASPSWVAWREIVLVGP